MKTQVETDSVIAEIHRTRREISERFNGDIAAIAADAARRQAAAGRPVWRAKPNEAVDVLPEACGRR